MGQYFKIIDAALPASIPVYGAKFGEIFWEELDLLDLRLKSWTTPVINPQYITTDPNCVQSSKGCSTLPNELLNHIIREIQSEVDQLCFALSFCRCWNNYQDLTRIRGICRPRMTAIGDNAEKTDLPPSILALFDITREDDEVDEGDEDEEEDSVWPKVAAYRTRYASERLASLCRRVFRRVSKQLNSTQTGTVKSIPKQMIKNGHIDKQVGYLSYGCEHWIGSDSTGCALSRSTTPELLVLCSWLKNTAYWELTSRSEDFSKNTECIMRNFDRKEFVLGSSIGGVEMLFRGFPKGDRSCGFPQALLILISRSSVSDLHMYGMSDETGETIIKGPWAGDEVEVIPLRDFLAQFRSGELLPKEWINVDSEVMPILVEFARKDGGLDREAALDPELATALEEQVQKLSQSWPTIEDLLSQSLTDDEKVNHYDNQSIAA